MSYNAKKAMLVILSMTIVGLIMNVSHEFFFVGMCAILGGLVAADYER